MLRAIVFSILSKSAFTSSTLDLICNATAEALRALWSEQINDARIAQEEPALC
jgi:hypothetical protein